MQGQVPPISEWCGHQNKMQTCAHCEDSMRQSSRCLLHGQKALRGVSQSRGAIHRHWHLWTTEQVRSCSGEALYTSTFTTTDDKIPVNAPETAPDNVVALTLPRIPPRESLSVKIPKVDFLGGEMVKKGSEKRIATKLESLTFGE